MSSSTLFPKYDQVGFLVLQCQNDHERDMFPLDLAHQSSHEHGTKYSDKGQLPELLPKVQD